jgi:hypothetical protein
MLRLSRTFLARRNNMGQTTFFIFNNHTLCIRSGFHDAFVEVEVLAVVFGDEKFHRVRSWILNFNLAGLFFVRIGNACMEASSKKHIGHVFE